MAAEGRGADHSLARVLFEEPYRFDFFQAVRLLERIYADRQPVGRGNEPGREAVRFRTLPSLKFPPSQIHELRRESAEDERGRRLPPEMVVAFMGLTGPLGLLPHSYTELIMERNREKDRTLHDFLDLFNHRAISLFYRAWEKYRFAVAYERGAEDRFTEFLFDLVGMGTRGLRGRLSLPDEGLLGYAGLVAQRPHSAVAAAAMIGDYFGVRAVVAQYAGQWLKFEAEDRTRLGGPNAQLGVNAVAGARVWDSQSKFRLRLGPLSLKEFAAFLPVGSAHRKAGDLGRLMAGQELDFDVQLVLRAKEVPGCILTTRAKRKPMLGWTTWLKTKPFGKDDEQVVLSLKR
jgi:type VI secretion system protein ImpH